MKRHKLAALLVTTYIGFNAAAHASAPQPVLESMKNLGAAIE